MRSVGHLSELDESEEKQKYISQANQKVADLTEQLHALDCKTLSELRVLDEVNLIADLSLLLIDLIEYFDVATNMNGDRLKTLASLIAAEMGGLLLEDIALCFKNSKVALYGPVYNRLDGAVIMSWLQAYKKDKLTRLETFNRSTTFSYKDDPYPRSKGDKGILKEQAAKLLEAKEKLGYLKKPTKGKK
jgi:hypothetical protein